MESPISKTPAKKSQRSRISSCKMSENRDPNRSPASRSAKSKKPPENLVRERKFIVVSKKKNEDPTKIRQAAYESLRASQDNFFRVDLAEKSSDKDKKQSQDSFFRVDLVEKSPDPVKSSVKNKKPIQNNFFRVDLGEKSSERAKSSVKDKNQSKDSFFRVDLFEKSTNPVQFSQDEDLITVSDHQGLSGSSKIRKLRSLVLEEAVNSMPEAGSGRVLHLVKAFEDMLSISTDDNKEEESSSKVLHWPLPGLHAPSKVMGNVPSSSSFEFSFPPKELDGKCNVYSSFDANDERISFEPKISEVGRKSRRSSSESLRSSWNTKLKVTRLKPFKLRTEQRGKVKEEQFFNKVKEMLIEEEKKRIPIAQGLPWTTDEPENLAKPPVKESTEPIDLVLHSDVRASERAAFDNFVAERLTLVEKMKMERERQRKLEEEEEIKRIRKELVPIAQPMPYFDRPFIPKRSTKPQTVPKEPRFHVRPHKSCDTEIGLINRD